MNNKQFILKELDLVEDYVVSNSEEETDKTDMNKYLADLDNLKNYILSLDNENDYVSSVSLQLCSVFAIIMAEYKDKQKHRKGN